MILQKEIDKTTESGLRASGRIARRGARLAARPWGVFGNGIIDAPKPCFSMVSMFSGCGGMDLGLRFAGFEVLWANDIESDACATYEQNLDKGIIQCGDIRDIRLPDFRHKKIDLLAACFPCQSFSTAGSRRGTDDENGKLNNFAIQAIKHFRPSIVIYENVRGMLSVRDGNKLLIEKICEKLHRRGYHVYLRLVNARQHHVPQNRMRVFIVGIHTALKGEFGFPAFGAEDRLTLADTIMDVPKRAHNASETISLGSVASDMGSKIPEGGCWKDIPDKYLSERFMRIRRHPEIYRSPTFYRCFGRGEVAGTITATFRPENSGVLHPVENRAYSVREAARIQSFPDWFKFYGRNAESMCRQVGNAVPPRLGYELGHAIIAMLAGKPMKELQPKMRLTNFLGAKRPLRISHPTIKHEKRR